MSRINCVLLAILLLASGSASPGAETHALSSALPIYSDAVGWLTVRNTIDPSWEELAWRYGDGLRPILVRRVLALQSKQKVAIAVPQSLPQLAKADCGDTSITQLPPTRAPCPLSAAEERSLRPKDVFKECTSCPEMVVIPAGRFTMGSPDNEKGRDHDEGPRHAVTIARPYAVGKFHVTVEQYESFVATTGYEARSQCWTLENGEGQIRDGRSFKDPGFAQAGSHPAVCLSWDDAKAYIGWLSKTTGKAYRLLSEAEWEYAARAGTTTRYWFGSNEREMCRYGNGIDRAARQQFAGTENWSVTCDDGFAFTSPVGSYAPNAFGLYDMHGNAWQRVEDCYHETYSGAPTDGSAWIDGECKYRVLRGGSWDSNPRGLRVAARDASAAVSRVYNDGFRLARTLGP